MKVVRWALGLVRKAVVGFVSRLYELALIAAAAAAGTSIVIWWEKIKAYFEELVR